MMRTSENAALSDFQDAFALALAEPAEAALPHSIAAVATMLNQPGFSVYRNTVLKGCIDALAANFPAVVGVVGSDWFRAAAAIYARAQPPRRPSLLFYGDGFPDFLARFEPARDMPYLAGVALLDRCWIEAHTARDQVPIAASDVHALGGAALERVVLRPHASARWTWFEGQPIASLWRLSRFGQEDSSAPGIEQRSEGLLIVRPQAVVENHDLDVTACAFLDACAAGNSVLEAGLAALAVDASADLAEIMQALLTAGAFGAIHFVERHSRSQT